MAFEVRKGNRFLNIILCLLANFVCFGVCYYTGIGVRIEHVGSFYAAAAFGMVPAIIVAIISQLVYALFYFGFSNILMLIPVLLILWLIRMAVNYGWLDTVVSSLGSMVLASLINSILVGLISLLIGRDAFLMGCCWYDIYNLLCGQAAYSTFAATVVTVVPYVLLNTFFTWILALFAYRITPKQTTLGFSENRFYRP